MLYHKPFISSSSYSYSFIELFIFAFLYIKNKIILNEKFTVKQLLFKNLSYLYKLQI